MDKTQQERFITVRKRIIEGVFARMNPMQRQAVFTLDGPVLILAGAGSGKTTVIINRIANMVQFGDAYTTDRVPEGIGQAEIQFLEEYADGENWEMERAFALIKNRAVMPWNILAITFTNKAAAELRSRLTAMLGEVASDVNASTFHAACARILRREIDRIGYTSSFTIYDTDDAVRVVKAALKELNLDEKRFAPKALLGAIGRAKDQLLSPEEYASTTKGDFLMEVTAKIYGLYQRQLERANALDFDDLIRLTVRLLRECPDVLEYYRNRFRYVMVDEYQDTNHAQFELVRLLSAHSGNLCVVGDDDQSIYKFRGATIENILQFEDTFAGAKVIRLEQNYRSTTTILEAANAVISNNTARKGKTLWTDNEQGNKVQIRRVADESMEAQFIAETILGHVAEGARYGDHVVLYRMNAQSQSIERGMVRTGVPYRIIGGQRFYDRKEIRDVIAYLTVLHNPSDTLRLRRIINEPKRKIGDGTVDTVMQIAAGEGLTAFQVLVQAEQFQVLGRKAAELSAFAVMMRELAEFAAHNPLDQLLDTLLERTGYLTMLQSEGFEGQTRIEHVEELKSVMKRYEEEAAESSLAGFLEEIALYTDIDRYDASEDAVVLMTMHAAKGLEFDYVFVAGIEEGVFPGHQSAMDPELIEEERRLAYVSLTRAKKQLCLTTATHRMLYGQTVRNMPSRFMKEIPQELCEAQDDTLILRQAQAEAGTTYEKKQRYSAYSRTSMAEQPAPAEPGQEVESTSVVVGDTVSHKVFGTGRVLSAVAMGNDLLVEVQFDKAGRKKVMAKFAKLVKNS